MYAGPGLVAALQGGLVQLLRHAQHSPQLLYCKTAEDPEPGLLAGAGAGDGEDDDDDCRVPRLSLEQLRAQYSPRRPLRFTEVDITLSAATRAEQPSLLGLVREWSYMASSLEEEDLISCFVSLSPFLYWWRHYDLP